MSATSRTYAHMCRDGHAAIGYDGGDDERCPLCHMRKELERFYLTWCDDLYEALKEWFRLHAEGKMRMYPTGGIGDAERLNVAWEKARAALTKARGEK